MPRLMPAWAQSSLTVMLWIFSGICVGVRKGDTELLEKVNAALAGISEADRTALFDAAIERGGE